MKKLSIIIPIYNEEKTLGELLSRVLSFPLPGWQKEIIAVDDASSDGTFKILEKHSDKIKIVRQEKNGGKGTAVKRGLGEATGDFIIIQDADLEYDPKEISRLVSVLEGGMTIVFGSRNIYHEKRRGFFVQRAGVWLITSVINLLYGAHLTDVWTCYKLFPREAKKFFVGGGFESEIIFTVEALFRGFKIKEVPISHKPREVKDGKKIKYRDGARALWRILLHRLGRLRKNDTAQVKDTSIFIVDPKTRSSLKREGDFLIAKDGDRYPVDASGRPYLMSGADLDAYADAHESGINWLKSFFKQFPLLYYAIWHFFCPVLMLVNGPRKIRKYAKAGAKIVDIGSGPERLGDEFINVDVFPFPEVDIVADACRLPFRDDSLDAVVSESVLEHVPEAREAAFEMQRVLKAGGYLYVSAPFIHPYHASPDDFNRWTASGLKHLFRGMEIKEVGVRSGPWSALLMFMAYWFGVLFSFGSKKVAPFITHFLMLFMGPLKFLDFLFFWIPGSEAVATHIYIIARKK